MPVLLHLLRHRFDALRALLVGGFRKKIAGGYTQKNHLRRDIGLPETATPSTPFRLAEPMVGLRR